MNCFRNDKIICLIVNNKEVYVEMDVICECKEDEDCKVDVSIKYCGQTYHGQGSEYFGIDAFVDLQKQLPKGVIIKSCLSCKHGNQCPVGNVPNELFCTKDVEIKQPEDLWLYTEDEIEREKRSCSYANVCDDWQKQSVEYFTFTEENLVDIETVNIDRSKPPLFRTIDYILQVKNPYYYKVGNVKVRVSYANRDYTVTDSFVRMIKSM